MENPLQYFTNRHCAWRTTGIGRPLRTHGADEKDRRVSTSTWNVGRRTSWREWSHETGGVGHTPAVRGSDGPDHSVTAATSKTEREWRQGKKNNVEGPLCEGVHTRHIERPSTAYGKEEGQSRRQSDPWTPLLERFGTIELERRSIAWTTLDLAMNVF
jgi:hypothetical protein